jgi:hypothetical protein
MGYATNLMRRAVVHYSVANRHRKGAMLSAWLDRHNCHSLIYVGALTSAEPYANANIVESHIAQDRTVVAGFNMYPGSSPFPFLVADGRSMPFRDNSVDFALANAVIEHVGGEDEQRSLVAEHCRVARCWAVTTPNKWFPVESHTSAVFRHWSTSWRDSREEFTRLLSLREFKQLMPEGTEMMGHWWSATFVALHCSKESSGWCLHRLGRQRG